jgi:serine protein kinase
MSLKDELAKIGDGLRERFLAERRVLSFFEYIALFESDPYGHSRDAARYVRDAFDHFGRYEVERPYGKATRYAIFDERDAASPRREFLVGHERVQQAFYGNLSNFARENRHSRLTLLHGPNGSAKSTFAACVQRGIEEYALLDDGALYSFSWIFPRSKDGKALGFAFASEQPPAGDTYAHLSEEQIDARLPSELREHPLHLLPMDERRRILVDAYARSETKETMPPDWLWSGELSSKNKKIFDALFTAYRGDLRRVLAHVRVERYLISRRYRCGAVTIGPQMAVDASERQITADRSLGALPASLSAVTLFEAYGELVDASGGVLEYSDLLKRPLDAWKYLLLAIETNELSLSMSNVALNCVMIGSSNELHLNAFRDHPEFNSFRGRLSLVRVPYQRDYLVEKQIYDSQIVPRITGKPVTEDATYVAALWAVLTRMRPSAMERLASTRLGTIAVDLKPIEKAELFAEGRVPARVSPEDAAELRNGIAELYEEFEGEPVYEGLTGVSPREMRTLLFDAAQSPKWPVFSPLAVLERLEQLVDNGEFDFLKENVERGYFEHRAFIAQAKHRWLDRVDERFKAASGLIDETQYLELFDRFVTHVSNWVKGERVYNRITSKYEDPDLEMMNTVEQILDPGGSADAFRDTLIGTVAAFAIDRPGEPIDYERVFPQHLTKLREHYYRERRSELAQRAMDVLGKLRGRTLDAGAAAAADATIAKLKERYGFVDAYLDESFAELLAVRYSP